MDNLDQDILDKDVLGDDMLSQSKSSSLDDNIANSVNEDPVDEDLSIGETLVDTAAGVGRGVLGFGQSLYELADFVTGDSFLPDYNIRKWAGESKTMTGSMAEGITQFLTGFIPVAGALGKAATVGKGLSGLSKFGKFAKITKAAKMGEKAQLNWRGDMIAGTVSDFISFSAHEDRLSNIINEYPELANPVTEFLAADDDDNELLGRLKNSIEGAMTDVALTVGMKGAFVKSLELLKQGRKEVPEGVDPLSVLDLDKISETADEVGKVGSDNFQSKVFKDDGATRAEVDIDKSKVELPKPSEEVKSVVDDVDEGLSKPSVIDPLKDSDAKVGRDLAKAQFPEGSFKDVKAQKKPLTPSLLGTNKALGSYMKQVYKQLNVDAARGVSISMKDAKEEAGTVLDMLLDDLEKLGVDADYVEAFTRRGDDITLDNAASYTMANRMMQNVFNEQAIMIAKDFKKIDPADTSKRTEMLATMKSLISQSVRINAANSELIASKAGTILRSQAKDVESSLKKIGLSDDEIKNGAKVGEFLDTIGKADEDTLIKVVDMLDEFSDRITMNPDVVGRLFSKDLLSEGLKFVKLFRMNMMLSGGKTQLGNIFLAIGHHYARRGWQNIGGMFDDPALVGKWMASTSSDLFYTEKLTKMAYHKNFAETVRTRVSAFEGAGGQKFDDSGLAADGGLLSRLLTGSMDVMAGADSALKSKLFRSNLVRLVTDEAHKRGITDQNEIAKMFMDAEKATILDSGRLNNSYNAERDAIAKKKESGDWDKMNAIQRTSFKSKARGTARKRQDGYEKMQERALYESDKTLHMQQPEEGSVSHKVLKSINAMPASDYIIPFKKTPINIISSGLSFAFAPARGARHLFAKTVLKPDGAKTVLKPDGSMVTRRDQWMEELGSKDTITRLEAKGKLVASTAMWGSFLTLIENQNDRITGGGPTDYNELRRLEETGWQKYSIKIGDKYYSYQKLDPIATMLGLAADMRDGMRNPSVDTESMALAYSAIALTSLKRNVLEKSFLIGVDQFLNSFNDENSMSSYMKNFGTSFLPALIPQSGEMITGDSVQAEAWTFMDAVKRRTLFDTGSLDPKRNILGEEMSFQEVSNVVDAGFDIIANVSEEKTDDVIEEIASLRHGFTLPSYNIAGGIDLRSFNQSNGRTAYDFYRMKHSEVVIGGKKLRSALSKLIKSNRYQSITAYSHPDFKTQRIAEISKVMNRYKAKALRETLIEFPEIDDIYKTSAVLRRQSRRGVDIQSQVEELINTYQ